MLFSYKNKVSFVVAEDLETKAKTMGIWYTWYI